MEEQQRAAFERAVERKKEESRIASEQTQHDHARGSEGVDGSVQEPLISTRTTQDAFDPRDKSSQKGKKTADKWNQ